ncbi:VanZ family protein [Pelagibacteraceae bacterium]|jgi:VanZ family protein|nr:VanZ family protein [Pelagibacteraceae bacterium]
MIRVLNYIFHISVIFLIIISLWPGSILGYFLYRDWGQQPNLVSNPFGTTINHFIYYFYVSLLGFFIYFKNKNFKILVYGLFFLSIILEFLHFIIPNRSFEVGDLIGNILGVIVAYSAIKIYLFLNKDD